MALPSNPIVNGYNTFTAWTTYASTYIPFRNTIREGISFLATELPADGLKTLVAKPLGLVGSVLKYIGREASYPAFGRLAQDASATKALISAVEIFKFPFTAFSEVKGEESTRQYCRLNTGKQERVDGPKLSEVEAVSGRVFQIANWFISLADGIGFVRNYRALPKSLENATPWIYTVAGGYMGAQSLYTEWKFAQGTWRDEKNGAVPAEKYYGCLNLATSAVYLFASLVGAAGLYYKDKAPSLLGRLQFASLVGIVIMPVAQKCYKQYMKANYWS